MVTIGVAVQGSTRVVGNYKTMIPEEVKTTENSAESEPIVKYFVMSIFATIIRTH